MNNEEIELKFFVDSDHSNEDVVKVVEDALSSYEIEKKVQKSLGNIYYDTKDLTLRNHDIGIRVRSIDDTYEETAKCSGIVVGGFHKRVEYNIPLKDENIDIQLFPAVMWHGLDIEDIESRLEKLFATNFVRTRWDLKVGDRILAQVCYDVGTIEVDNNVSPINEIELELIDGTLHELLEIAKCLVRKDEISLHLDSRSKAHRGYELAKLTPVPKAKSFCLLEGSELTLMQEYFKMYIEHEQILLSNFDLRSLSVMTLAAYQLQKLSKEREYDLIIPHLLELEKIATDSDDKHEKFMKLISSKHYLLFILETYGKLFNQ